MDQFTARYDDVFLRNDTKAYFDFVQIVIDTSVKRNYRQLLLLDAILLILTRKARATPMIGQKDTVVDNTTIPNTSRGGALGRAFDQHEAFRLSVYCAYNLILPLDNSIHDVGPLVDINPPWNSLRQLKVRKFISFGLFFFHAFSPFTDRT